MFSWFNAMMSGGGTILIMIVLVLVGRTAHHTRDYREAADRSRHALDRNTQQLDALRREWLSNGAITSHHIAAGTIEAGQLSGRSFPIPDEVSLQEALERLHQYGSGRTWQQRIDDACDYYARTGDGEALDFALVLTEAAGSRAHEPMGAYTGIYHVEWLNGRRTGRIRSDKWRAEHPVPGYLLRPP